ncbi:MAG: SurA N-terminal domain-containing protein [Patescibacteria group bacterium]
MKKPKKPKLKAPKLHPVIKRPIKGAGALASKGVSKLPIKRAKTTEEKVSDALSNVPRITNDTVSDHREEVLSSARKYIYPLQHSKHRIIRITIGILVAVLVIFFVYCGLALYKFNSTSAFVYDVTRIVPFPVAKVGSNWVSYESYLFELRRNMHYYQTQQQANFSTKDGKTQLDRLSKQALAKVTQDAYVKQLANENDVSVSDQVVKNQLVLVKSQNRLGSNDRVFREVLNEFWGWNESDFKRELKQQLLAQAVVAKLDTATNTKAKTALSQLKGGADFAATAKAVSQDPLTAPNGGQYPNALTVNDREIPPIVTNAVFKLKPNEVSDILNSGYSLEIVKVIEAAAGSVRAAHIQFNFKPITDYTKPLQAKEAPRYYISL